MARPKAADPTVALSIRVRASTMAAITAAATDRSRTARKHIEAMVERTFGTDLPPPAARRMTKREPRPAMGPNVHG